MLDLFNATTLNIFTDASVLTTPSNESISCPGAVIYLGDIQIDESCKILRSSTNNDGEMSAIHLGIASSLYLMYNDPNLKISRVNLFSDSQISINGLRQWIFNWVNCQMNNTLYNSKGTEVKNQKVMINTIKTILDYNLSINLYHQKGHCKNNIKKAKRVFKASNGFDISDIEAAFISDKNDQVDLLTKYRLRELQDLEMQNKRIFPISFDMGNMNFKQYKGLIGGK